MATKLPITDVEAFQKLVLWARANGIAVDVLEVGNVRMQFRDLRIGGEPTGDKPASKPAQTIYERYGRALLEQAEPDGSLDHATDDGEDEVANA